VDDIEHFVGQAKDKLLRRKRNADTATNAA
jgi:hypothetical protein